MMPFIYFPPSMHLLIVVEDDLNAYLSVVERRKCRRHCAIGL